MAVSSLSPENIRLLLCEEAVSVNLMKSNYSTSRLIRFLRGTGEPSPSKQQQSRRGDRAWRPSSWTNYTFRRQKIPLVVVPTHHFWSHTEIWLLLLISPYFYDFWRDYFWGYITQRYTSVAISWHPQTSWNKLFEFLKGQTEVAIWIRH